MKFHLISPTSDPSTKNFHCPNTIGEGNTAYSELGLAPHPRTKKDWLAGGAASRYLCILTRKHQNLTGDTSKKLWDNGRNLVLPLYVMPPAWASLYFREQCKGNHKVVNINLCCQLKLWASPSSTEHQCLLQASRHKGNLHHKRQA